MRSIFLILGIALVFSYQGFTQKEYHRDYYASGVLKAEGWKEDEKPKGYWYFYYENGAVAQKGRLRNTQKEGYWYFYTSKRQLHKEGHFIHNKAEKWWIFYDIAAANSKKAVVRKYQYRNGKRNGYCLLYANDKLFKAERYQNDQKMGEWTDVFSFKKDNPNVSL